MARPQYILALDQGTTSSRAIVFDPEGNQIAIASRPLNVSFPRDGWVEQYADEIWQTQYEALKEATKSIPLNSIAAIGITNQRETIVAWDRQSGRPLCPAIVWQCRRSADICAKLREQGAEPEIRRKTGLVLDPYFSATKIAWMLRNISGLRARAKKGTLVFGTVDSWILFNLTRSSRPTFATEPSNASRTMLYGLKARGWEKDLLARFGLTTRNLCFVRPSNSLFGYTTILGYKVPITGVLGDQQAALYGHGCETEFNAKCTFGTGAFLLSNTGERIVYSKSGLLTTVAWAISRAGRVDYSYALEGSVFIAGALIQWLRDGIGLIGQYSDVEKRAKSVSDSGGVVVVPAFVGLGAPHWDESARGAIFGITRDTSREHVIRASLEAVAHQVSDLLELNEFEYVRELRIDGGMSSNELFCQILADLTRRRVIPAANAEVTALGAAKMAALGAKIRWQDTAQKSSKVKLSYRPKATISLVGPQRQSWKKAVSRSKAWAI